MILVFLPLRNVGEFTTICATLKHRRHPAFAIPVYEADMVHLECDLIDSFASKHDLLKSIFCT